VCFNDLSHQLKGTAVISANETKLVEIFRVVLDLNDKCDILAVRRISEPHWDSLAHVSIVAAIESEFSLQMEFSEMDRMTSFLATRLLLEEKNL
jgi:acyl carrier protein